MFLSAVPWMAMTDVGAGPGQLPSWVAESGTIAANVVMWQALGVTAAKRRLVGGAAGQTRPGR